MPIGNQETRHDETVYDGVSAQGPVQRVENTKVGNWEVSLIKPNPLSDPNQYEVGIPGLDMEPDFSVILIEGLALSKIVYRLIIANLKITNNAEQSMEEAHRLIMEFEDELPELPAEELE